MRSNMALLIPCHLYLNLKFSEISEFSEVRLPAATRESIPVYVNHIHVCAWEVLSSYTGIDLDGYYVHSMTM